MTKSNTTMQRVWDQSEQSQTPLVVLLAIASHADDDTGIAFPGIDLLSAKARIKPRQVINIIAKLEESGELIRIPSRGRGIANHYLITIGFTENEIRENLLNCETLDLSPEQIELAIRKRATDYTLLTGKGLKRAVDCTYSDSEKVQSDTANVQPIAPIKVKKVQSKRKKVQQPLHPNKDNKQKEDIYITDNPIPDQSDIPSDPAPDPDSPKQPTPAQEMFSRLADICQVDLGAMTEKQRGELNQTEKILRGTGAMPTDLLGFAEFWYQFDWRGKQDPPQPPKPAQVREEWGKYKSYLASLQPEPTPALPDHLIDRQAPIPAPAATTPERQAWQQIAEILSGSMTKAAFEMHIKNAQPVCWQNGTLTVQAASAESYDVIIHRLMHIFDRVARQIEPGLHVEFVLG